MSRLPPQPAFRRGRRGAWAAVALGLVGLPAQAHRLDEVLQAALLTVGADAVRLELNLTPGIETFDSIGPLLDPDHDGQITPAEAEGFAHHVRVGLDLRLDGKALELALGGVKHPPLPQLREGTDSISLVFTATARPTPGEHELQFHNRFLAPHSVYLANALMPEFPDRVELLGQKRSADQRQHSLQFRVHAGIGTPAGRPPDPGGFRPWHLVAAGLAGLLASLVLRRTR